MRFQFIRPSEVLAHYIRNYWVLEADAFEGEICERVIPTGNIEIMFHYKKSFAVKNNSGQTSQPQSLVSGITSHFSDVITQGESGVIAVTFYPSGACNFFRFPLQQIENASVGLHDICHLSIHEVEEKICEATDLRNRIQIIEDFLMKRFNPVISKELAPIKFGVELINQLKGQITAENLSKRLFMTPKTLERKFSQYIGKTPKQFIRIVRFQRVIQNLSNLHDCNLTQLSIDNGYFDQAHFIKDFKSMSGYTPREFLSLGPCQSDYFD